MNKLVKYELLGAIGGLMYVTLELLFRGRSHWTMFVLGGFLFALIGLINNKFSWDMSLLKQGIIGAIAITLSELVVGYIVNIRLGWQIWDYSDMPFNLYGQICLPFSLLWIFVAVAAVVMDDYLRWWMFGEEFPHYKII